MVKGRARGEYLLRNRDGAQLGSLHTGWALRRGQIRTGLGTWQVRRHGDRQVSASDADGVVIWLARRRACVPGPGLQPRWRLRSSWAYQGILTRGEAVMVARLAALRRRCEVEISGDWEQRDLVALMVCYALLVRRRAGTGGPC